MGLRDVGSQATHIDDELQHDVENGQNTTCSDESHLEVKDHKDLELNGQLNSENTSDVKHLVEESPEDEGDDNPQYGWFGIRPGFLQFFNNAKGYLFFVCVFAIAQGMTVNGLVYVVTTTLERRFNLTSARSGFISSCYDFSVMVVIVFVTYLGEKGHKPRWIGTGALIFAMGSLLFTLPHFATGYYQPRQGSSDITTCDINGTGSGGCDGLGETGLSNYYWVFVAAQALHGLGAAPLYTLGVTYMDDNVKPVAVAIYIGIFQAMSTLGPAVGYIVGGAFLTFYTDLQVDPLEEFGLTSESPLWVGAWWIGFFFSALICILIVIPILGYPRSLPGAKAFEKLRVESTQKGTAFSARAGFGNKLMDFPRAVWNLIKNIPFMCLCFAAITEWFILASIAVFGPKYFESQFNLTSGTAALVAGLQVIPSALIGCLMGGFIVRRFSLGYRGMIKFCIFVMCISLVSFSAFFIVCPNADFAGVTVLYENTGTPYVGEESNLTSSCNADCSCADNYDPVCGSNDVLYYSPCHAGCLKMDDNDDGTEYSDCLCIASNSSDVSRAIPGKCDFQCSGWWGFFTLIIVMLLSTFFAIVPSITATLRCVSTSQRAFALGINSLLYRALGTVPGPVIFGKLIDNACLIWEEDCDGARSCWMYDNQTLAKNALVMNACLKVGSIVFFIGALLFYSPVAEEGAIDSETKDISEMKGDKDPLDFYNKVDMTDTTAL